MKTLARRSLRSTLLLIGFLPTLLMVGCSTFSMQGLDSTGKVTWLVEESGAPLLSRTADFSITTTRTDPVTGVVETTTIGRNTDENASGQVEMMKGMMQIMQMLLSTKIAPATGVK